MRGVEHAAQGVEHAASWAGHTASSAWEAVEGLPTPWTGLTPHSGADVAHLFNPKLPWRDEYDYVGPLLSNRNLGQSQPFFARTVGGSPLAPVLFPWRSSPWGTTPQKLASFFPVPGMPGGAMPVVQPTSPVAASPPSEGTRIPMPGAPTRKTPTPTSAVPPPSAPAPAAPTPAKL